MKLLIPIICFLQLTFVVAQSNFQVQIGGSLEDIAYSCKKAADGAYIIAGRTFSFGTGGWEEYVTKFNTNADTVWTRTFGNSQYDELQDIELTNDGGEYAVVATNSCGSVTSDCYLSTVSVLNTEIEKYKVYPSILACGELLHLPSSKTYHLYDLQGNLTHSIPESISKLRMDFPAGLYLLKNEWGTIKIVLTK